MKTNLILAIVAAVLAVPTTYTLIHDSTQYTAIDTMPKMFDGFTADSVKIIVLAKAKQQDGKPVLNEKGEPELEQLGLVKLDDRWRIAGGEMDGAPAQSLKIEQDVLDHMKRIRIDPQNVRKDVSAEDLKARDLGLEPKSTIPEKGLLIQCQDATRKPVAELVLGKDASGGKWGDDVVKGFFVRRKDKNEIVLYDSQEAQYWNPTLKADDWIDKNLHQYTEAKVKTFRVKNPKGEVVFEKEKATPDPKGGTPALDKWKATTAPAGAGALKQQEVTNLVSRFARLDAARYQQRLATVKKKDVGLEPPSFEISATLEDGTVHQLLVGSKIAEKQEYHAIVNGKDAADFLVSVHDFTVNGFERDPKDFFDPPASEVTSQPTSQPASHPAVEPPATKPGETPPKKE